MNTHAGKRTSDVDDSGYSNVVPIRPSQYILSSESTEDYEIPDINPGLSIDQIRQEIERAVLIASARHAEAAIMQDDPYIPIYLSALLPDRIPASDIQSLESLNDIADLSNSLDIDDEWDD